MRSRPISLPLDSDTVRSLHVGEAVHLSGIFVTGRDAAHKWLYEHFQQPQKSSAQDLGIIAALKPVLQRGLIYHCGPVVTQDEAGNYQFTSAGPTTSIREEPYQADIMKAFQLGGVAGKGGMGQHTLQACTELPAVYFHAIGGVGALIARTIKRVLAVYKLEFGTPEALWVIEVKDFPAVVTMDSHGMSLHDSIFTQSTQKFNEINNLHF